MNMILLLVLSLTLSACITADRYLGSTEAWITPDGTVYYKSNKNQENLNAELSKDDAGRPLFKIATTAVTPESAIAAVAAANLKMIELYNKLADQIAALAAAGKTAGS